MAQSSTDKILSLVDVAGSADKLKQYRATIDKVLPEASGSKERYWMMYAKLAQQFISDPKITDKQSVLTCMFNAVKLGLNPDPLFGEIYFIPYSGKLTHQVGYKGMIALSMRSGEVKNVAAYQVFENDTFTFFEDEKGQHFHFEPNYKGDRGNEILVLSIFTRADGSSFVLPVTSSHIDAIKKVSLSRTPASPWGNKVYEPEMRKKTAIRQHWKTQPKSIEIAQVVEYEEAAERGEVMKIQHPELEGIIDDLIEKSEQQQEENVLPVFDEPRKRQPGEDD